jgi:hypothetical protein
VITRIQCDVYQLPGIWRILDDNHRAKVFQEFIVSIAGNRQVISLIFRR